MEGEKDGWVQIGDAARRVLADSARRSAEARKKAKETARQRRRRLVPRARCAATLKTSLPRP